MGLLEEEGQKRKLRKYLFVRKVVGGVWGGYRGYYSQLDYLEDSVDLLGIGILIFFQ